MNTTALPAWLLFRIAAPFAFRRDAAIARKLDGFAATEAGSALDMLKAAELTTDPRLRRLFFRHAMDEATHARLFRDAARRLAPGRRSGSEYDLIHATRQNLFARMGLVRFIAFVYVAEERGALQFKSLEHHFRNREELRSLLARIGKDERFHVQYSRHLLDGFRRDGRRAEVEWALLQVRFTRAWEAWRRAGRVLGDRLSRLTLGVIYLVLLPLFALIARVRDPARAGWKPAAKRASSLAAARSQY